MKKINFEHQNIRFDRNEIAGSLGDLGTFIVFLFDIGITELMYMFV